MTAFWGSTGVSLLGGRKDFGLYKRRSRTAILMSPAIEASGRRPL